MDTLCSDLKSSEYYNLELFVSLNRLATLALTCSWEAINDIHINLMDKNVHYIKLIEMFEIPPTVWSYYYCILKIRDSEK